MPPLSKLFVKTICIIAVLFMSTGMFSVTVFAKGNFRGKTARPLRYQPDGTDFVIENGSEFFNRPLYGTNTAFRVDAGDRPEFSLYMPGRGGNLRLGIKTSTSQKWLFDTARIITRYRPGSMLYEISDPLLGRGKLRLTALPMGDTEGLVLRVELQGSTLPVELFWAYGGASGERGRRDGDIGTENIPISAYFQLKPEFCKGNSFVINGNAFTLQGKPGTIVGLAPLGSYLTVVDATHWNSLRELLSSSNAKTELPLIVGRMILPLGKSVYLGLQRVPQASADRGELDTYKAVKNEAPGAGGGPMVDLPFAYKLEDLPRVFDAAERKRQALASKVVADTPDPFINAAVAALSISGDSVWDELQGVFMHGAVAWRTKLLGWRGPYVGDALGWHDRARRHFTYWAGRQNTSPIQSGPLKPDAAVNFARNEPGLHTNGDMSNSHYDMNTVYIDALFRHFLWTGDIEFIHQVWPVIERHLAWERRLFRRPFGSDGLPLYEAYTVIWASDDLEYHGGGVTHSSAYNYFHNRMAARIARLLGTDAGIYERESELIARAMRRELWLKDRGWFGEWKDLLGQQLVHPNAALWTFYHTVDSEVPTPFESWQMARFVDTQNSRIPVHGPGVPSGDYYTLPTTSWMPYTWSTNNVVMSEVAHTSLAYWQAGRNDAAFSLFKGSILDSMYLGLCPGNAGMTTAFDMARSESQRDFADSAGVMSRALVEGLFGVRPDALAGELFVRPGLPADWDHASLLHADFKFGFQRKGLIESYTIEPRFAKPMKLRLRVAALRDQVAKVTVNGRSTKWQMVEDSIGQPRIEIESAAAETYEVVIVWSGEKPATTTAPAIVAEGTELSAKFGVAKLIEVIDPQLTLGTITRGTNFVNAMAAGTRGHRTAFAKVEQGELTWWLPIAFEIRPAFEIIQAEQQTADNLRFVFRNNTDGPIDSESKIHIGNETLVCRIKAAAFDDSNEVAITPTQLLPGSNRIVVELGDSGGGRIVRGVVTNWKLKTDFSRTNLET
ncbi:MAG: glycogen debranching protein, partial [Acidobacteria bacterium]